MEAAINNDANRAFDDEGRAPRKAPDEHRHELIRDKGCADDRASERCCTHGTSSLPGTARVRVIDKRACRAHSLARAQNRLRWWRIGSSGRRKARGPSRPAHIADAANSSVEQRARWARPLSGWCRSSRSGYHGGRRWRRASRRFGARDAGVASVALVVAASRLRMGGVQRCMRPTTSPYIPNHSTHTVVRNKNGYRPTKIAIR